MCSSRVFWVCVLMGAVGFLGAPIQATANFVNFETPHVNPIAMSPNGTVIAVCNTPDGRLEIFNIQGIAPVHTASIPVGVDPVSVRFRTSIEVWVANQVSDSISVIDLNREAVIDTLMAPHDVGAGLHLDEPADIIFAGDPERAFVTFSQSNRVAVWDPNNRSVAPTVIPIVGEDPRALAMSPDGQYVYAAVFESGNRSTLLAGGAFDLGTIPFPPNAVSDPSGPYGGQNPPPNGPGNTFVPERSGDASSENLPVGLIVRQDENDAWRDDNGTDWSSFITGINASKSGRPVGWRLLDHDVARINVSTLAVDYATSVMNICMNLAVNPVDGRIAVIGTDAFNEVRFEPNVNGRFIHSEIAFIDPNSLDATVVDMNTHLGDYSDNNIAPSERANSIGDPRGIAWNAAGDRCYVVGLGSNNLAIFDGAGNRVGSTIELPEGPTGVILDEGRDRLYVVSKFASILTQVDLAGKGTTSTVPIHDASPEAIKVGRKHLYDTHKNSGLGHIACASCHVDSRMDRLAWDLGDPSAGIKPLNDDEDPQNLGANTPGLRVNNTSPSFRNWHPMKGPMSTQTLQDIIRHEPFHWRGDRDGIEEFNPAFVGLQAADSMLTTEEMQEYEDFLATIHYPPNPFRNLDNSLPTNLPLGDLGHRSNGRFAGNDGLNAGDPLLNGNAVRGLTLYRDFDRPLDNDNFACVLCHTLPTGIGPNAQLIDPVTGIWEELPPGTDGEARHALVSVDGSTNRAIKTANLRNVYEKVGCEFTVTDSLAGFGYLHDGSADSITRFVSSTVFEFDTDQEISDVVALMLAFSGSQYPLAPFFDTAFGPRQLEPPGTVSLDAHAAVGRQFTITDFNDVLSGGPYADMINTLIAEQRQGDIDIVVHQPDSFGVFRGYRMNEGKGGASVMQPDSASEATVLLNTLLLNVSVNRPLTLTAVPTGTAHRIAVDRDEDGILNYDEIRDHDPDTAGVQNPFDEGNADSTGNNGSLSPDGIPDGENDFDNDGITNAAELLNGTSPVVVTRGKEDISGDGSTDAVDIQLVINGSLGIGEPGMPTDVDGDGDTDAVDIQLVINATLAG